LRSRVEGCWSRGPEELILIIAGEAKTTYVKLLQHTLAEIIVNARRKLRSYHRKRTDPEYFLGFVGCIEQDDLKVMAAVIEQDCEQIEPFDRPRF
jgi:hypothetical protein